MTTLSLLSRFLAAGLAAAGITAASAAPLTGAVSSAGTICLGSTPTAPTPSECTHQDASTLTYIDFIHGSLAPGGLTPTPGDPGAMIFLTALGDLMPLAGQTGMMHDILLPAGDVLADFVPMDVTWHAMGTDGATYTFALTELLSIYRLNHHAIDIRGTGDLCRNGTDCNLFSFIFTAQDAEGAIRTSWSLSQSGFLEGKVPEPGSLTLLGLGLVGLAIGARRRRQR